MYKILLILLFVPLTIVATEKGKYTKNKVIDKEFKVNNNATLNISNKYGNVHIVTSNTNKITIKVSITTNGNDEEKVKKRLEQIDVDFDASSSFVSAKTIIEKNRSSWSWFGKSNSINMEINYHISMPITNNLEVSNDYGSVNLDKIEGETKFDIDYGKLLIGELWNTKNSINIDYTNKSTIDLIQGGTINADYSTLHIEKGYRINLSADYSHLSFGMVGVLDYNCDYGSLKIGDSGNVSGNSDYMHTTVEKLRGTGDFDMDYGSLKIKELGNEFKNIIVKASYTNTNIGIKPTNNFTFNTTLNYGSFKYGSDFTINKEIIKTTSKYYEGFYNSANSTSNITIKSSYGNISLKN